MIKIPAINPIRLIKKSDQNKMITIDSRIAENKTWCGVGTNRYYQPLPINKSIFFQLYSDENITTIDIKAYDERNTLIDNIVSKNVTSSLGHKYTSHEVVFSSSAYFRLEITIGSEVLISEYIHTIVVSDDILTIEFRNFENDFGMIFNANNNTTALYVLGRMKKFVPKVDKVVYTDDPGEVVMLKATPQRSWDVEIFEVPDWLAETLNLIGSCSNVSINGISVKIPEGLSIEYADNYGIGELTFNAIQSNWNYGN